jgi:tRNA A-37 threonylcarbamoyl transferase component Bud32
MLRVAGLSKTGAIVARAKVFSRKRGKKCDRNRAFQALGSISGAHGLAQRSGTIACPAGKAAHARGAMRDVKDTLRALVRVSYDGRVQKTFRGPRAQERFDNEVRVLRYLEERGCPFVPRLLEAEPSLLRIVTTNCGTRVEHLDAERTKEIFAELEKYGVRHDDAEMRNITYRNSDGRFCIIDFEFATILDDAGSK